MFFESVLYDLPAVANRRGGPMQACKGRGPVFVRSQPVKHPILGVASVLSGGAAVITGEAIKFIFASIGLLCSSWGRPEGRVFLNFELSNLLWHGSNNCQTQLSLVMMKSSDIYGNYAAGDILKEVASQEKVCFKKHEQSCKVKSAVPSQSDDRRPSPRRPFP